MSCPVHTPKISNCCLCFPDDTPIGYYRRLVNRVERELPASELATAVVTALGAAQPVLASLEQSQAALQIAIHTIRTWHGMGMGPTEAQAWELYQASPEMQQINAAIARTDR